MIMFLNMMVEYGVDQDLFDPYWRENMAKAKAAEINLAGISTECQALSKVKGKDEFKCTWFRVDKPPLIRKIGDSSEMQKAVCSACRRTQTVVAGLEERDVKIAELETKLGAISTQKLKVPKCNRGAVLNHDKEDQLIMTNCFRHRGAPVSVAKFCKIQARGLPCMFFAEIVVGVEGRA